jgi:YHS domain-containing protein
MKLAIVVALTVLGIDALVYAADADKPAPAPSTQPAAKPVNTKCPVTGEEIDPKIITTYQGKAIAFCCKDCIDDFKKSPEKYIKGLK